MENIEIDLREGTATDRFSINTVEAIETNTDGDWLIYKKDTPYVYIVRGTKAMSFKDGIVVFI